LLSLIFSEAVMAGGGQEYLHPQTGRPGYWKCGRCIDSGDDREDMVGDESEAVVRVKVSRK
jgi:hypothetical protein